MKLKSIVAVVGRSKYILHTSRKVRPCSDWKCNLALPIGKIALFAKNLLDEISSHPKNLADDLME